MPGGGGRSERSRLFKIGWKRCLYFFIANEATELRSEVDSVANYNAAQCRQKLSNSA